MAKQKIIETEADVKKLIKKWFDDEGAWSYAPVSRGMGAHGIPDRIGCVPLLVTSDMVGQIIGLFVGVEAKKPARGGEKNAGCSGLQVMQLEDIAATGGLAYVVDSEKDISVLGLALRELQNSGSALRWIESTVIKLRTRLGIKNG